MLPNRLRQIAGFEPEPSTADTQLRTRTVCLDRIEQALAAIRAVPRSGHRLAPSTRRSGLRKGFHGFIRKKDNEEVAPLEQTPNREEIIL